MPPAFTALLKCECPRLQDRSASETEKRASHSNGEPTDGVKGCANTPESVRMRQSLER